MVFNVSQDVYMTNLGVSYILCKIKYREKSIYFSENIFRKKLSENKKENETGR